MTRTRQLLAALAFSLVSLPLAAQINDTYVIPAAANVPGAFGTRWMTQMSLFNPQFDYSLKVSVTFLPTGGGNSTEVLITVPANGVVFTDNVLDEVFDRYPASGSLLIATFPEDNPGVPNQVIDRSVLVTTNTFNNSSTGTYGQTIPGVWAGLQDFDTDGISAIAHGIRHLSQFGWRTNFGAVNLGPNPVTLRISVYDRDGRRLVNGAGYFLGRYAHGQWSLPVEIDQGTVEFWVDDSSRQAVVFPYTSTIDQWSGDPTYQTPALLATTKVLFPKTARPAAGATPGRKYTLDEARAVRSGATRLGEKTLVAKQRQ